LEAKYTAGTTAGDPGTYAYSSSFRCATAYIELSASLPPADVLGEIFYLGFKDSEYIGAETGYGFSETYWYGYNYSSAWPS
jgi:hypothetical protein